MGFYVVDLLLPEGEEEKAAAIEEIAAAIAAAISRALGPGPEDDGEEIPF